MSLRLESRRASVPEIRYPAGLPVAERARDILAALSRNQVLIVAGETGSGKSTQLPKVCLQAGRGVAGLIGHTQPRRIAARAVAERIAQELGTEVGGLVGYTVRFTDRVRESTLVQVMTDGILLSQLQRDRMLSRYDTLIIDEAHERSLNIDFILGYLRRLLPRRPDLKVIVTSATIDTERLSRHFGDAPVVEVSGRSHPVEVRYRPPAEDADAPDAICDAVEELWTEGSGDILVFSSGEREIRDAADALRALDLPETEIVPLYARLSASEQHRVFEPHTGRRVVVATNVAETSLTVPGIRYVVDPGTARISRYSRRTKVQRLPIEAISRASADQRAGRCGRVAPGICTRLYDEEDYESRPEFTEPEILRTNLASVILQMAALGLGDMAEFPFVDPPDSRNVKDGIALLEELGALDPSGGLTPVGRRLARLPLDPRLGRMVVEAERNDCVSEVLVIAAALSIQDPRERPAERRQAAAESHARFADPDSDFVSLLNLWNYLHERQRSMSGSQFRKLCRTEFLSYPRVREWQDIHAQLRDALGSRSRGQRAPADRDLVHMSLMSGLLSHLGFRDGAGMDYLGARGARFWISPASALFKKPPRWAMAAELVETTRLWAHAAARIRPEWAERVSPHLLKRTHSEASWDADRGFAVAFERVTLYGLPIIASRRVDYGRIDAATAREIFIVHALVRGEWRTRNPALLRNRALVDEARALEGRVRRRDAVVDERWLFEFYDTRIGREVVSGPSFDEWWKAVRAAQPKLLDLVLPAAVDEREYPDVWRQGRLELRLTYQFEPGAEADGVTVHVPLVILNQLDGSGFDWQVPGLRAELVTALVRALPRQMRQGFVSPAERARAFLERADPSMGPLRAVLAHELGVPVDAFREERVPAHLKVTFRIEDGRAVMLGSGKDLDELKRRLSEPMGAAVAAAAHEMERTGLRDWIFGSLPRTLESDGVRGHPAISDEGDSVAIRVFASVADQDRAMLAGARRLILLTVGPKPRALERLLDRDTAVPLGGRVSLDDCVRCATDGLIAENGGAPWDEASFRQLQERVRPALVEEILRVAGAAGVVVTGVAAIEARLGRERFPPPAVADVRSQIAEVVYPGFPARTALRRVADVPRYLRAIERRLDKLRDDPARDAALMGRVQQVQAEYVKARARVEPGELDHVAWMIQELRVSLFAQQLGTAQRVSEERILREIREPRERA